MKEHDKPEKPKRGGGLTSASELLPSIIDPVSAVALSPIKERLLAMPDEEPDTVLFSHSVLCQTCMPYRDPGDLRVWSRRNGNIRLLIQAGQALDPVTEEFIELGLPFGPKPRIALFHLNAEAVRTQSPVIELEDSLTAFVRKTLGLDPKGRNIRVVRDQLSRLAAADFRLGMTNGTQAVTIKGSVVQGFDLWTPREARQRVLWSSFVTFSREYFESLMRHAIPLDPEAIKRLSHSAQGLDVYVWMAQRCHRIDPAKPVLIPWESLRQQFGGAYTRLDSFKRAFQTTLGQVRMAYKDAKFSVDSRGMTIAHSRPPVLKRLSAAR